MVGAFFYRPLHRLIKHETGGACALTILVKATQLATLRKLIDLAFFSVFRTKFERNNVKEQEVEQ